MSYRAWALTVLTLGFAIAATGALEAQAQRGMGGIGRPVRLEGYWGGTRADADVIGTLVVSPDGQRKRTLGVTGAQAYQPPEEGMQIFRASTLQPIALILRGRKEEVARIMDAEPSERIVVFGMYTGSSAELVVSSVEVKTLPTPAPPD